jgi:hypothetical protein
MVDDWNESRRKRAGDQGLSDSESETTCSSLMVLLVSTSVVLSPEKVWFVCRWRAGVVLDDMDTSC